MIKCEKRRLIKLREEFYIIVDNIIVKFLSLIFNKKADLTLHNFPAVYIFFQNRKKTKTAHLLFFIEFFVLHKISFNLITIIDEENTLATFCASPPVAHLPR